MRVPLEWLKTLVAVEASAEEVATRVTMGGLEVEGIEDSPTGPVLDVYITPNRGDCLSMLGVAREVAALYDLPLNIPVPTVSTPGGEILKFTSVEIQAPDLCPRYSARLVRNIKVGPSPSWMQQRLEAAGQRAINNVVDVTNYVMLELGQPLHAFDHDKLAGGRIVVRRARPDETIRTLDGEDRKLHPEVLVIADAENPVAVAGLMGGADAEVSSTTTHILLESANFNPLSIRRGSRTLNLRTEASYRYERVVDPEIAHRAVDRACELLQLMGQAGVVPGVIDIYPGKTSSRSIDVRVSRAGELLGMEIDFAIASDCLRRLGFKYTNDSDLVHVEIPSFRTDIILEEDLVEEIGRIHGYENIPERLPLGVTTRGGDSTDGRFITELKNILAGSGLQEVVTHSLTGPSLYDTPNDIKMRVPVRNALSSEISGLRRSLLPSLLNAASHNAAHGQQALAIFEIGHVWQREENSAPMSDIDPQEFTAIGGLLCGSLVSTAWDKSSRSPAADFSTARGLIEKLMHSLHISNCRFEPLGKLTEEMPHMHPGRSAVIKLGEGTIIGVVGELHPSLADRVGLKARIMLFEMDMRDIQKSASKQVSRFIPISKFPSVMRDVAPRVTLNIPYEDLKSAVLSAHVELLEDIKLTDIFQGSPLPEGMKSCTLSLTFRSSDRTLTESEITEGMNKIRTALTECCSAVFAS